MENTERLEIYAYKRAQRGQTVKIEANAEPWDHEWLTPAERRRLKRGRGESHTHQGLLLEVKDTDGVTRVVRRRCEECAPYPRQRPRVGGLAA